MSAPPENNVVTLETAFLVVREENFELLSLQPLQQHTGNKMPGQKIPTDMVNFTDSYSYEENYKTDSISSRSSSPKSLLDTDYSVSESSESPEGSIIFDFDGDAEKISNELDNMKITEIQAEEMMKEGLDMRHVLQAAWKLKPKITKKFKKGALWDLGFILPQFEWYAMYLAVRATPKGVVWS